MPKPAPGFINETLQRLRTINKAAQKAGEKQGGVTIAYNLNDGFVNGTFIFPIEQVDGDEGFSIKGIDFIETEEPNTTL